MKVVIMAGGKGSRITSIASDIPKPMIPIAGKPVLEHEISCLRDQGLTDIIITVSHMSSAIMNYFGDGSGISPITGKPFGVNIEYFYEEIPLGNAGALFKIRDRLDSDFVLLNADSVFNIDFFRFIQFHENHGGLVTLFTHPNNHPYDSGLIISDENHVVQKWLTKEDIRPEYYENRVNAGLHIINPSVLDNIKIDPNSIGMVDNQGKIKKIDLDRDILKPLANTGKMYCYDSPEYVKDMGTPDRYYDVIKDFELGIVFQKNLRNKQKAVFLDRDGTINKYVGFLDNIDEFELLPKVSEAIRKINSSDYLAIVITNQPVIARGELSVHDLNEIHKKMSTLLGQERAYIDHIYYCPHHPDKGYKGEIKELKINCNCRKPKPGLILQAARDYNIDLSKSWMVGDSKNDVLAGLSAGCKTAFISEISTYQFGQSITVNSLFEFVDYIFGGHYDNL